MRINRNGFFSLFFKFFFSTKKKTRICELKLYKNEVTRISLNNNRVNPKYNILKKNLV